MKTTLPEPVCPLGYPLKQLDDHFGGDKARFWEWMRGQTMVLCEGRRWSPELNHFEPTACVDHPHGTVVYKHDVEQYLAGKEPLD